MSFVVQNRQSGKITILECAGRIATQEDANHLADAYWEVMQNSEHVIVNLKRVTILGSLGLGALILMNQWAAANGKNLKIASPSGVVREILDVTRLSDVLSIYPEEAQALAALAANAA